MKKEIVLANGLSSSIPGRDISDSLGNEELLKSNVEKRAGNGITGEEASKSLPFDIDLHFFTTNQKTLHSHWYSNEERSFSVII